MAKVRVGASGTEFGALGKHWEGDDTFFDLGGGILIWDSRQTMYIRTAINGKYT